jgi:hypothetical protein
MIMMSVEQLVERLAREIEVSEETSPVQLCSPQIPHVLTRARTRAATVGSQQLGAYLKVFYGFLSTFTQYSKTGQNLFIQFHCS